MDDVILLAPTWTSKWCQGATAMGERIRSGHWVDELATPRRCAECRRAGQTARYRQHNPVNTDSTRPAIFDRKHRLLVYRIGREMPELAVQRRLVSGRWNALYKKLGVTKIQWVSQFARQDRSCAICGADDPDTFWTTDHCHQTGKFRGILCSGCNVMLSGVEKPGWLAAAQEYLRQNG